MIALGCYASARPVPVSVVTRMRALLESSAYTSSSLDSDPPFTFAAAAHDYRRVKTPRGRFVQVLGHAYNLGPPEHLDVLLDAGRHLELTQLSGDYVLVIWEPHSRTLSLISDTLGSIPFYYSLQRGNLVWGTSPRIVATDPSFPVSVRPEGVVSFLQLGYVIGDGTLLQGINVLRPREWLMFDGYRLRRSARPLVFTGTRWHMPLAPLIEEFHQLLSSIIARQVTSHSSVTLLLSGGLDSRILAGLLAPRVRLQTLTYGRWYLRESQLAGRVARSLGVRNCLVRYDPAFIVTHGREFAEAVDGQCDALHAFWKPLADRTPTNVPVVIGYFLDALSGQSLRYGGDSADHQTAISAWLQHFSANLFTGVDLSALLCPHLSDIARTYTVKTISDIAYHYEHPFQAVFAIHLERQHRLISFLATLFRQRTSLLAPGADHSLLDFVCSLAAMSLGGQHLYRQMIRKHYPGLARIAYANDGRPIEANIREQVSAYLNTLIRGWLTPVLPSRLHLSRTNIVASLAHLDSSTTGLLALLPELEASLDLISGYVRPEAVRLLISKFLRDGTEGERLRILLSLAWFFRQLYGVTAPPLPRLYPESSLVAATDV